MLADESFSLNIVKFENRKLDGTIVINDFEYAIRIERDKIRGTSYANKTEKDLRKEEIRVRIVGKNVDKNWLVGEIIK